ncbi:hypothetical protein PIB30_029204 [Stylosanthes scabra]|uniref:RNase H type-1 domain-containing protein n=1 Tax=Stylosanthes scabra TaxID=79078 RepID=A0ABU6QCK7_9FABA|nr:hypothetical protein [Stylosanthes scabra]
MAAAPKGGEHNGGGDNGDGSSEKEGPNDGLAVSKAMTSMRQKAGVPSDGLSTLAVANLRPDFLRFRINFSDGFFILTTSEPTVTSASVSRRYWPSLQRGSEKVHDLLARDWKVNVSPIYRSANTMADALAKNATRATSSYVELLDLDADTLGLLQHDDRIIALVV